MRKSFKITWYIAIFFTSIILCWTVFLQLFSLPVTYNEAGTIPENTWGIVFGTNPETPDGNTNLYFEERMEGVLALIKSGKIQKLILSGDGISRTNYDETKSMEDYLIAKGISKDILLQDPHGIDTWSSMERAKELCSCDSITLISQPFHTPRAYIIGLKMHFKNITILNTPDDKWWKSIYTYFREILSRAKLGIRLIITQ